MLNASTIMSFCHLTSAIAPPPPLIPATATVLDAIASMSPENSACAWACGIDPNTNRLPNPVQCSCVLVAEGDRLIGIVTDRDLLGLSALGCDLATVAITTVMAAPVLTLKLAEFTDLSIPFNLMQQHRVHHLPLVDDQGAVVGLLTDDILGRLLLQERAELIQTLQQDEVERQQQQELLRTIIDTIPSKIFIKDWDGRFLLANRAIAEAFQTTIQEIVGKRDADLHTDQSLVEQFHQQNRIVIESQQALFLPEEKALSSNGDERWFQWQKYPVVLPEHKMFAVLGIGIDITDHKTVQTILHQYERVVSATTDGIALLDRNYVYQLVNRVYVEWHGKTREEIIGHSVAELLGETVFETLVKPRFDQCLAGEVQQYEAWFDYKNSGQRFVRVIYAPYFEVDGAIAGVVVTTHDLTSIKQAETQLELQNTILERIARAEPLSEILHELLSAMELQLADSICSIMLCDRNGRLHSGLAPHLPEAYLRAIDGIAIGEGVGSCGTAAFRREPVITSDIATDPLWQNYQELALGYGLRACWSFPLFASDGAVLGTFGVYYRDCRTPKPGEIDSILQAANLAGIAIERQQASDVLKQLNQELEAQVAERTRALQASEERWQLALRGTNDGIWDWDLLNHQVFFSSRWKAMHGFAEDEVGDRPEEWSGAIHPDDYERVMAAVEAHFAGQTEFFEVEYRVRHKDGSYFWILDRGQALRDESGQVIRMSGSETDITERKRTDEALQKSEQRYRVLMDSASDAILLGSAQGNLIEGNQKAIELLGYTRDELVHLHLSQIHPAEVMESVRSHFSEIILHDRGPCFETLVLRKDGTTVPVEITGSLIELDGEPIAMGIFRDIRDRIQAEQQLRDLSERLDLALQSAQIGIWEWNYMNHCLIWDDRMCALYGISREDFTGRYEDWSQRVHPDDLQNLLEHEQQAIRGERNGYAEFRVVHPDGTIRYLMTNSLFQRSFSGEPQRVIGLNVDITELKLSEQENRQLRERLQFLLSATPAVIFTCKPNDDYGATFISDNILQVTGYTSAEFLAESSFWANHIHPEDMPRVFAGLPQLFERGHYLHEYRFRHQAGHYLWIQNELRLICDSQGTPIEIVGYFVDISDRKQAELALQNSETRFRRVFDSSVVGMLFANFQGQILEANARFLEIVGYTRADLEAGRLRWDAITPPEYTALDQAFIEQLTQCGSAQPREKEYYRKDGSRVSVLLGAAVLPDTTDQTVCVVLDISDRKQLEHSKNRLVAILEASTDYIGMSDISGQVIWNNTAIKQLCGIKNDAELAHRTLAEYHPQRTIKMLEQQAIPTAIATGSWLGESVLLDANGQEISVSQLLLAHKSPQGEVEFFSAIMRDIRVQKEYEQRLERTNAEMMRATRLKDEFLANMSHELRTPLNAILGMAEGLQDEVLGELNTRQKKAIATVEQSGQHLLGLINDILELSKVEAGKLELSISQVSVAQLCRSSMDFIRQQAFKKQLQLNLRLSPDLGDIAVDERRMRQVLINLLINAVKFTSAGGQITLEAHREPIAPNLTERISVVQLISPPDDTTSPCPEDRYSLCLSVADTGIGIAPADQARLFQPFVQIDSSLNRQYEGTGLGLALVKRIVELHGGEVSLFSRPNEGSCFTVCLPYTCAIENRPSLAASGAPPLPPAVTPIPEAIAAPPPTNAPLILLAEDNAVNIFTISSYLEAKGYHVVVAKNGEEAIAQTLLHHPDLILMDIQMPKVGGLEAISTIRKNRENANTPIIALTALAMEGDRERCLKAGANEYISKPVKLKYLLATIQHFLGEDVT